MEPQIVPGSVKLASVSTGAISTISDISGSGNELVANDEPTLIESDPNFKSSSVISFDGVDDGFTIPNLGSISLPYTVVLVANNLDPTNNGILWNTDTVDQLRFLENGITGAWRLQVGAAIIDSGIIGSSDPDILVAKVTAAETVFRVNGVEVGSIISGIASPAPGAVEIGGFNLDGWEGRLGFHMIADIVDDTRILQTERYLREKF
jgi:hypothetical protein